MKRRKTLKILAITVTLSALFGFILSRKNNNLSLLIHATGCVSGISYTLLQRHDEEWNPVAEAWKEIELEREKINNQYVLDIETHSTELEDLRLFHQEELEEVRQQHHEELNNQREECLSENRQIIDLYENEMELYVEQLQLKENLLKQAKLPKLASGISRTEYYSNKLINFLYSKNIDCDYSDSWEEYAYDLIRLVPKNATLKDIKNYTEELQLELRLQCLPSFEIVQGCIQIKIDTRLLDTVPKKQETKLKLVTDNWLPEIAKKIIHGKVDGETQSGKSTFVQNLSNLLSSIYSDAEFISIDPKYPLSLDWESELSDWQRKPKYPGIKTALNGLKELSGEINQRLELVTEDVQNGKKPRKFSKKVFIVDEIDWITLEYGKEATDNLQVGLKVGAALNVIVVYFGQTPRCSKLKMTKDDFRNSTNISLGSNIPDAINTYVFDDSYGRELLDLYWRENNAGNVFICLVAQKGKKPFLALLPEPGKYTPLKNLEAIIDNSFELTSVDDSTIIKLINEGLRDSEIVQRLWDIKPSRSQDYKNSINRIENIRLNLDE